MINRLLYINKEIETLISETHIIDWDNYKRAIGRFVCIFYYITQPFYIFKRLKKQDGTHPKIIVSLTSIPSRINVLWVTLESLMRQSHLPDRIIIYLAKEEFDGKTLPKSVLKYTKKGVEIEYCENLKSHKKYYYTMKNYRNDFCITVDDDIVYSENMIENLLRTYSQYPEGIICSRANVIRTLNNDTMSYGRWKSIGLYKDKNVDGKDIFFTTGGGTLFPSWLLPDITFDITKMMRLCETTDDIWLNYMARLADIKIYWTGTIDNECLFYWDSQKECLADYNIYEGGNDRNLDRMREEFGALL